jgi:hypothetical protein
MRVLLSHHTTAEERERRGAADGWLAMDGLALCNNNQIEKSFQVGQATAIKNRKK